MQQLSKLSKVLCMKMEKYHIPALLNETIGGLNINPNGTYVDVTFGGGGHSKEILSHLGENGKLIAFDQDEDAIKNTLNDKRFVFVRSNFRYLSNFLKYHNIENVDGIIGDLGVSFHHFDNWERGFSFRFSGKLDMRMNQKSTVTAEKIINEYSESQLADIFYLYGELRNGRKMASHIVKERKKERITSIEQFVAILQPFFFKEKEKKELARLFQALRIEVNQELEVLKEFLQQSISALKPKGRIVILTYHSLEDRLVKNFFKSGNVEGKIEKDFFGNVISPFAIINSKVIIPSEEEIAINPRSRSAKLRIAEKI